MPINRRINREQLQDVFDYLEVGLNEDEQELLQSKLLAAQQVADDEVDVFGDFPKTTFQTFIDSKYQDIWRTAYRQSEEYQQQRRFIQTQLAGRKPKPSAQWTSQLTEAMSERLVEQQYREHIEGFKSNTSEDVSAVRKAMLLEFANNQFDFHGESDEERIQRYLMHQKRLFLNEANTLHRLHEVIVRVEGVGADRAESPLITAPDYRRWARFLIEANDEETPELFEKLSIGIKEEERLETIEKWSHIAGLCLLSVSIALSIISAGHVHVAESAKEGVEQGHAGTEFVSLFVTGIVLCLKGEKKLGGVYIGLGLSLLAMQITTFVSDFGAHHFMTAASSTAGLAFTVAACSFALAFIDQHQIDNAQKRLNIVNEKIDGIDEELGREGLLQGQKVRKQQERASKVAELAVLEQRVDAKQAYLVEHRRLRSDIEGYNTLAEDIRAEITVLNENITRFTERRAEIVASINTRRDEAREADVDVDQEALQALILEQEDVESSLQMAIVSRNHEQERLGQIDALVHAREHALEALEASDEAHTPSLEELQSLRETTRQSIELADNELLQLDRDINDATLTDERRNELKAERRELVKLAILEQAKIADHTLSRNLWVSYGLAVAMVGVFALVGSVATMGAIPIAAIAVAALGFGISCLRQKFLGGHSKENRLKESKEDIDTLNDIIERKQQLKANTGIDFSKQVALSPNGQGKTTSFEQYLQDKIINHPEKAKRILDILRELSQDGLGEAQKQRSLHQLQEALAEKRTSIDVFSRKTIGTKLLDAHLQDGADDEGEGEVVAMAV